VAEINDEPVETTGDGNAVKSTAKELARKRRQLRTALNRYATPPVSDEAIEQNVRFAREAFALDQVEVNILLLVLRSERNPYLNDLAQDVLYELRDPAGVIAALLGIHQRDVLQRLAPEGALIKCGLLHLADDGIDGGLGGRLGCLRMTRCVLKAMNFIHASCQEWVATLIGKPCATALQWEDFQHLGATRDLLAGVVAGALETCAKGINILLHGPVGTGKTELAKALAAHSGMNVWSIGEASDDGDEPTRWERLAALKCMQQLLAKQKGSLILLDEAQDVLESDGSILCTDSGRQVEQSKVYLNRLLEQNAVPIIWTSNSVAAIDQAVLRRMLLAVELRTPDRLGRTRIWQRILAEKELQLDEGAVERLSSRYLAPPAVAANAVRAAVLSGGGEAAIEEALGGVLEVLGLAAGALEPTAHDFDPALVNCEVDLTKLAQQLAQPETTRQWSLCLDGAPGTGKSQFARYLALRLGMEVMHRRASDLLSPWVGMSEQQIAGAFREARSRRALLVLDEADSLLSDRRHAMRSWEVTQVNEMLTWMENHPLPFICTTNLVDRLDQASLRRFTLKLRFDPLTPAQASLAFQRLLGCPAPRLLPEGLAPGDFATVRRKRALFGDVSPSLLADWLDQEVAAKGIRPQPIGFLANPLGFSTGR